MRLSIDNLKEIVSNIKKEIINKRIDEITLVNSRLFLLTISHLNKKLVIDLDNSNPHIGLIKIDYDELSLPNNFIKKILNKGKPLISDISLINEDKIIKIVTSATDAYYHHNNYYLYIELINAHANMILTNKDNVILGAFYETNINAPRIILTNFKYALPEKKLDNYVNKELSMKEYDEYINKSFINSLEKRKKELFGPILKKHEKKIVGLEKKIKKITLEEENAKALDKYKEYGETILMNVNEIKKGISSYNNIPLNSTKNAIENANIYFNKYKKCKRTLETTKIILTNLNKELEEEKYKLDVLKLSNEDEINKLINNKENKRKDKDKDHAYLPYYIKYKETIYYYGHNALENDYLSFKLFNKNSDVIWMHLKDKPSSHLIINKSNPNNEELDLASSILLYVSKENVGEIMYTSRKNITRSNKLGEANILQYKSINLRKINSLVYELIKREKRYHG